MLGRSLFPVGWKIQIKLSHFLNFRRVASDEFSPAFQDRDRREQRLGEGSTVTEES